MQHARYHADPALVRRAHSEVRFGGGRLDTVVLRRLLRLLVAVPLVLVLLLCVVAALATVFVFVAVKRVRSYRVAVLALERRVELGLGPDLDTLRGGAAVGGPWQALIDSAGAHLVPRCVELGACAGPGNHELRLCRDTALHRGASRLRELLGLGAVHAQAAGEHDVLARQPAAARRCRLCGGLWFRGRLGRL